jgi:uncharacterized protein
LRIAIKDLKPGINELDLVIEKSAIDPEMAPLARDGSLRVSIDNQENTLFIKGSAQVRIALECSRCLKPFSQDLGAEIQAVAASEGNSDFDQESDEDIIRFSRTDEYIDLTQLVTEELNTNMPMAAVCRESCRGLCPICGADLNKTACLCSAKSMDPRWEPLLKLKKE